MLIRNILISVIGHLVQLPPHLHTVLTQHIIFITLMFKPKLQLFTTQSPNVSCPVPTPSSASQVSSPINLSSVLIWKTYIQVTYVCNLFLSLVSGSKYLTCILLKFQHDDMMSSKFTLDFETNNPLPEYFLTFF